LFVEANGTRLHYLEWGRAGRVLVLIHGLGDNAHLFDDLAPAFVDQFRVIAYSRRGHGRSDRTPPYDNATLVRDLIGLLDELGIESADFAGYSMGGNEMTALAVAQPGRVNSMVYLDSAFDYSDPDYARAAAAVTPILRCIPPDEYFGGLEQMERVEAYCRESEQAPVATELFESEILKGPAREYSRIRCPVLAIYAQATLSPNIKDEARRRAGALWEEEYIAPFRTSSMARVRREIANIEVLSVPGGHNDFLFTAREQVVGAMRRFLHV